MHREIRNIFWCFVVLVLMPFVVSAQSSSINAYSPYSMYGMGELLTPGSAQMRSMGGVGIASRNYGQINPLNPAAASIAPQKSFLFDVSFDGTHYRNSQTKYNAEGVALPKPAMAVYNGANIHSISLTFPLAKRMGFSFAISPYSSVGYNMTAIEQDENAWADVGQVKYNYQGEGDITEVKLGVGWEIFKGFSLGIAGMYYWGGIDRQFTTRIVNNVVGDGSMLSTIGSNNYNVSNFKFQAGVQYSVINTDKRSLTIGATYDIGGSLRPKVTRLTYINDNLTTVVYKDDYRSEIRLPMQIAGGIFYQDVKWSAGFDYVFQNWKGKNAKLADLIEQGVEVAYANTSTYKVGVEYTPNRFDVRRYYNRMSYRAGLRYGGYYQTFGGEHLNQYAVTIGIGFPLRFLGASSVDVGFEYGARGSHKRIAGGSIGLIKQDYFKFAIGLSMFGEDYWFVRPKYD